MNDPKRPASTADGGESMPVGGCITLTSKTNDDVTSFLLLENGDKLELE